MSILPFKVLSTHHYKYTRNTGHNMTVLVPVAINPSIRGRVLSYGDEIGVFTSDGICVGGITWEGKNVAITVWGDNEQTADIDGSKNGDVIQFRLWDANRQKEFAATVSLSSGNLHYSPDGITIISHIAAKAEKSTQKLKVADNRNGNTNTADSYDDGSVQQRDSTLKIALSDKHSRNQTAADFKKDKKLIGKRPAGDNKKYAVNLLTPTDNATIPSDSIVLSWQGRAGKRGGYYVDIAKDSVMKNLVYDSAFYTKDTFIVINSLDNGMYWWHVRQDTIKHDSAVSRRGSFKVSLKSIYSDPFSASWGKSDSTGRSFSIAFTLPASSHVIFRIVNSSGKRILTVKERMSAGENRIKVTTDKLQKGTYSYNLKTDKYSIQSKFSIE